jgi:hypothetical protein
MAKKLPPVHPGEILREEFLVPLKLTPYAVAAALNVPRTRIERIANWRARHDSNVCPQTIDTQTVARKLRIRFPIDGSESGSQRKFFVTVRRPRSRPSWFRRLRAPDWIYPRAPPTPE